MKKQIIFLCSVIGFATLHAQLNDTIQLKETVISATKWQQKSKYLPSRVIGIDASKAQFENAQTTADLLQNTGQIFVQKSQTAAGSPVLRGFETNRVLLVVDGVRMNNAIYRGGHVQDVITTDNAIFDKTEILFGPSSTIYGSDALGGVMHFYTKNPQLNNESKNAFIRYSSANNEKTVHLDFNVGFKKIASLTSITYSDFGDLHVGKSGDFGTPNHYGECYMYVTRDKSNNTDIININKNPEIMVGSAYKQIDMVQKILFRQNNDISHILNLQYSTNIGNVPRYDRLLEYTYKALNPSKPNELTPNKPTFAENGYGPQMRFMGAYYLNLSNQNNFYDKARLILSYQAIDQDRIQRKLNSNKRRTQMEDLSVYTANFDFMKRMASSITLNYGVEETYNVEKSSVTNIDITTGAEKSGAATRYPEGGNYWNSLGAYLQANSNLTSIFTLSGGLRVTSVYLKSIFKDSLWNTTASPLIKFPFDKATVSSVAPAGNISLVANLPTGTKLSGIVSTGFRAPNIDDMVKFSEYTSSGNIVVPNVDLKPEYAYNAEFNINQSFAEKVKIDAGVYYTILDNAMTVQSATFQGSETIILDGVSYNAVSVQNANSARIWGFYADILVRPIKNVNVIASISSTYGKYTNEKKELVPMDHIPPLFGKINVDYTLNDLKLEAFVRFSASKKMTDYSPSGEDNLSQTAISGFDGTNYTYTGTPSWYTLNFRAGYSFTKMISLNAGIENILDRHYRQFASGISSPGRNIYGTVRVSF